MQEDLLAANSELLCAFSSTKYNSDRSFGDEGFAPQKKSGITLLGDAKEFL
ncbi:MAG: hypothetical protein ABI180_14855 [Microcoleus sp.]